MSLPDDTEDRRRAADGQDTEDDDAMRMDIHAIDIPKSTLAVAALLWTILAGLMTWNLLATLDNREGQIRTEGRLDSLEKRVDKLEDKR